MEEKRPAPFPLRMPEEMRNSLEGHAKQNGRSLNAEIIHRLEQSFADSSGNQISDEEKKALRKAALDAMLDAIRDAGGRIK